MSKETDRLRDFILRYGNLGKAFVYSCGTNNKLKYFINGNEMISCEPCSKSLKGTIKIFDGTQVIKEQCFYDKLEITNVCLPNSITEIRIGAFEKCLDLVEINIPHSVSKIGKNAFRNCLSLKTLDLRGTKIKKIPENLCSGCISLEEVYLPDYDNLIVENSAFWGCNKIHTLYLPETAQISARAFSEEMYREIEKIKVNRKQIVLYDHNYSTNNTESGRLQEVNHNVNAAKDSKENNTRNIRIMTPDELRKCIDDSKDKKYIVAGVTYFIDSKNKICCKVISDPAKKDNRLEADEINILNGTEVIDSDAFYLTTAKSIKIPDTVTEIRDYAFKDSGIEYIKLGNNITHIGKWAFAECKNLKEIDLSECNITVIPEGMCYKCCNMLTVYLPHKTESVDSYAFKFCPYIIKLYTTDKNLISEKSFDISNPLSVRLYNA